MEGETELVGDTAAARRVPLTQPPRPPLTPGLEQMLKRDSLCPSAGMRNLEEQAEGTGEHRRKEAPRTLQRSLSTAGYGSTQYHQGGATATQEQSVSE